MSNLNIIVWAKTRPFQTLATHALVSGHVASVLTRQYLSPGDRRWIAEELRIDLEKLPAFVGYLTSLHDIGKAEYCFQAKDEESAKRLKGTEYQEAFLPGIRHEKSGRAALKAIWKELGENNRSLTLCAHVVGAHHQGRNGAGHFDRASAWYEIQKAFEKKMREHFLNGEAVALPTFDRDNQGQIAAMLLGVMILSDWIASGDVFLDAENWIHDRFACRHIEALTKDFLRKTDMKAQRIRWPKTFSGLWRNIPRSGRRLMQVEMENLMRTAPERTQLVLIEAPMGEGKTEAGIYAATRMAEQWGKNGFYVALPTAATSNQMVQRVRAMMNMRNIPANVRLLHSTAWLDAQAPNHANPHDPSNVFAQWLAPLKRGLLGQFAVGTIDQVMMSVLHVPQGAMRLLGLSNKCLIIDEIHSYDAYMSEILVRLLEWCKAMQVPVVMMSATLPPELKAKLLAPYTSDKLSGQYPLITTIGESGKVTETVVGVTSHRLVAQVRTLRALKTPSAIAKAAIKKVKNGGCLCILMNTVKEAQAVYSSIKNAGFQAVMEFHAQFELDRRTEIENECLRMFGKGSTCRPEQFILVATQVVEQSLDVDFDFMFTAIAPIDLLFQRLGRVFRHDSTARPLGVTHPELTLILPEKDGEYGATGYVYPECLLRSAERILTNHRTVRVPEDIAPLVREGYDEKNAPKSEAEAWKKNNIVNAAEAGASHEYLIRQPWKSYSALDDSELFDDNDEWLISKTRLAAPTTRVALLEPNEMAAVKPFIWTVDGQPTAEVYKKEVAEMVMKKSVSLLTKRLGDKFPESSKQAIPGAMLIAGIVILPTIGGKFVLPNGKVIHHDKNLGILID